MSVIKEIRKVLWSKFIDIAVWIADKRPVMKFLVKKAERKLWKDIAEDAQDDIRAAQELKYAFVRNLLKTTEAHLAAGRMSKDVFSEKSLWKIYQKERLPVREKEMPFIPAFLF